MNRSESSAVVTEEAQRSSPRETPRASGGSPPRPPETGGGGGGGGGGGRRFFESYKREQGKSVRVGSFCGALALIGWGAMFLYDRLAIYEGDEAWRLLITPGIPLLVFTLFAAAAWWVIFAHRSTGDFMIATEGEMKKVSWSSKKEIIGSTKVVIVFTFLLALIIFVVDVAFQALFTWIGVLRT
ncbi:MAG: preprotein translocase subunit SecE [Planctomycetes bacterium]|nr:preprotein translocase subunit SecE [Planctomycetota bacterium]